MIDMNIDVLTHTHRPERTVCVAARGDQMADSLVDVDLDDEREYADVMDDVPYEDYVGEFERPNDGLYNSTQKPDNKARTKALIERLVRTYSHYGPFEHPTIIRTER